MSTEPLMKVIYNCETKEEIVIPMTAEEIAELEEAQKASEAQRVAFEAEQAARQAAKESAIAKLSALGLTAEEAAALLP